MTIQPVTSSVDLKALCRAVTPLLLAGGPGTAPPRRRVEPLPIASRSIDGEVPLPVACYIDGVQAIRLLTVRGDRPVYLAWVAAGAIDPSKRKVVEASEHLALLCSHLDVDWAQTLPGNCPVVPLDDHLREDIDRSARAWMDATRRDAEQALAKLAVSSPTDAWTVLDGSLADLSGAAIHVPPDGLHLVGVVKTTATQYLTDEHLRVHNLPEGWISDAFKLPARRRGDLDRASCYLRQRDAGPLAWEHGLVRIEVPARHAQLLPRAAATALAGRQHRGTSDPRWDRHQFWIARLESALRERAPHPLTSG